MEWNEPTYISYLIKGSSYEGCSGMHFVRACVVVGCLIRAKKKYNSNGVNGLSRRCSRISRLESLLFFAEENIIVQERERLDLLCLRLQFFFILCTRLNRVNAMWWWWSINIRIVLNRLWPFLSNGDRKVSEELNEISPPALFFLYFAHYLHLKGELSGWSECNVHVDRRRHISYDLKSSTESADYFSSVLFFLFSIYVRLCWVY